MNCNPIVHRRRSIRLSGYDYTQAGMYFVTLCTQERMCLFGNVINEQMQLNRAGKMVQTIWHEIPQYYEGIDIDEFVVMPNHIHGIIVIVGTSYVSSDHEGRAQGPAPTFSLSDIVHRFKTMSTKQYIDGVKQYGFRSFPNKLWQRSYWDRVIRSEQELNEVREYIYNNPVQWETDQLIPKNFE